MPEEIFNKLGYKEFKKKWNDYPLKVLKTNKKPQKIKDADYLNYKFMAGVIYKQFIKYINNPSTIKYVRKKQGNEPVIWKGVRCSLERKTFMLIDQEIHPEHGPMDIDYMEFWIEEKEDNSSSPKKSGRKTRHNKAYMLSIFSEVIKTIDGKINHDNYAYALGLYLENSDIQAPKSSWVGDHLSEQIKNENIIRGHA